MWTKLIQYLTVTAFLMALPVAAGAGPLAFSFAQGGYDDGAEVTGYFRGADTDGNGQLSSATGEIDAFEMTFSGNSIVPGFAFDLSDLSGFAYTLDGGPLGDLSGPAFEGILALNGSNEYVAGPGPFAECGTGFDCAYVYDFDTAQIDYSDDRIAVQPVAEPVTGAIMAIGLIGAGLIRREWKRA